MEVCLTSPKSSAVIAMATVQNNVDEYYVDVLVNIVFRKTTLLPRPTGRLTTIGQAQAQCIPWPKRNVR